MRYRIFFGLMTTACIITSCAVHQESQPYEIAEQTYVHKYGTPVPSHDWISRGEHGKIISTLNNGVVVSKAYVAGVLDGETTYTFPHNNTVEHVEIYSQGRLTKNTTYYQPGAPCEEALYNPDNSKNITIWYENGTPKGREFYDQAGCLVNAEYYDINHQKDSWVSSGEGLRIVRDQYGQVFSKDTIKDGLMTVRTTDHQNGIPKDIVPYHHGVIEGTLKRFLPGGEPSMIEEWMGGRQNGLTIAYQNGEKYAEILYVDGVKTGIERHFRDGYIVVEEISWSADRKHGPSIKYIGSTPKTDWYFQGKPVTKGNFDAMGGVLAGT